MKLDVKYFSLWTACIVILAMQTVNSSAQRIPPKPFSITVNSSQGLYFGAFFTGATGGTITVYPDGTRAATGDVIQASLGYTFSAAIYQVTAQVGTRIGILNGPDVTLTGSNGGSMTLHIGGSLPASPFVTSVTPPSTTQITVGGTLTVGTILANPVGSYSGNFTITFVQE